MSEECLEEMMRGANTVSVTIQLPKRVCSACGEAIEGDSLEFIQEGYELGKISEGPVSSSSLGDYHMGCFPTTSGELQGE